MAGGVEILGIYDRATTAAVGVRAVLGEGLGEVVTYSPVPDPAQTLPVYRAHNTSVVACGFFRRSVTGLAVLGMLTLALLPPEHLHAAGTEEDHHADVIHRHWEAHHPAAPAVHEDDHATLWIDSPFTHPEVTSHVAPDAQGAVSDLSRPRDASLHAWPIVRVSVHDPPGVTSNGLRAPPFLAA